MEYDPVNTILVTLEHSYRLALGETPEVHAGVRRCGGETNGGTFERWSALALRMERYAVASVLVASDRQDGLACRHLPKLDEARPRRCAVELGIWRELAMGQWPLV